MIWSAGSAAAAPCNDRQLSATSRAGSVTPRPDGWRLTDRRLDGGSGGCWDTGQIWTRSAQPFPRILNYFTAPYFARVECRSDQLDWSVLVVTLIEILMLFGKKMMASWPFGSCGPAIKTSEEHDHIRSLIWFFFLHKLKKDEWTPLHPFVIIKPAE